MQPVFRQILSAACSVPEKAAVVAGDCALTYGELASRVVRAAANMASRHRIRPGDRIILLAEANPDFVCAYLAAHSLGAICTPLDPNAGPARLREIAERLQPSLAIADTALPVDRIPNVPFAGLVELPEERSGPGAREVPRESPADVLFTTGTTGRSKGVVLSHRAIAASTAHINAFIGTSRDDIEVLPLPLSHSFGLGRMRCVLSLGATLVLTRGFVNTAGFADALRAHRATGFASVPAGFAILLSDGGDMLAHFARQLRYVEIGSSPMPLEQKERLTELLPQTRICMHYGLTEASRSAFLSFHDDREKLKSIGRPSGGVQIRVTLESGEEAGRDVEGHLEISGAHLMSEYWRDAELTARTVREGWLRTGDLGRRDTDGYFWLSARESDIINVGGRKVAPQQIEEILLHHPAIAECACAGIADPQGLSGQIVSVWLVAAKGTDPLPRFPELARMLRAELEPYKIPRQFHWVEKLPRSSSGKVLRRQLAECDQPDHT